MTFVAQENLFQHHIDFLNQCADDLSNAIGNRTYFSVILENGLNWYLNDWALEEYADFARTLLTCIDRYNKGEPNPTDKEIVQYTYNLAELISRNQTKANCKACCNNLKSKAESFMDGFKDSEINTKDGMESFRDDLEATTSDIVTDFRAAGNFLKAKAKKAGVATANWVLSQLTREDSTDNNQDK